MSDQDPTRPIEPIRPAESDATQVFPVVPDPVEPTDPGGPGGPIDGGGLPPLYGPEPDRRWLWAIGVVGALLIALILFLLLDRGDKTTTAAPSSTTPSSSTTSATSTTVPTTTAKPAVTASSSTTAPSTTSTIAPARCTGHTNPSDPEAPARTLYDAWRIGDRDCADKLASDKAVSDLFKLQPNGPEWSFQGCQEVADPDPHHDCAFTYEGGASHFLERYGAIDGWQIYEVQFVAD